MHTRTRRIRTATGVALLAAAVAVGGMTTTGAWFSAASTGGGVVSAATLAISEVGQRVDTAVEATDVLPMTDAEAPTAATAVPVTLRNTGSIPLDWTFQLIAPSSVPAAGLPKFRFQLFDAADAPIGGVHRLGDMPAVTTGTVLARGQRLPAGADLGVRIRMWLAPDAGNELQQASARFTVVVNGMQTGAPRAQQLTLQATPSGDPTGTATALRWNDVTPLLAEGGVTATPVYTVERSASGDFADAVTVYSGPRTSADDTTSGATAALAGTATRVEAYGWGDASYAIVDGQVRYWGTVRRAGGGPATWFSTSVPTRLDGVRGTAVDIAAGADHVCVLESAGTVSCAGFNQHGQLGSGSSTPSRNETSTATDDLRTTATPIADPDGVFTGRRIVDISAGDGFTCALASDGTTACWGDNSTNVVSAGSQHSSSPVPVRKDLGTSVPAVALASSWLSTCVVLDPARAVRGDNIRCWGWKGDGELGTGVDGWGSTSATPVAIADPNGVLVGTTALEGGVSTFCALTSATATVNVACWGDNRYGQAGASFLADRQPTPQRIALDARRMTSVSVGQGAGCATDTAGGLWCWGSNGNGRIGLGTTRSSAPVLVVDRTGSMRGTPATGVAVGAEHTCVVGRSGALACSGDDAAGQLGRPLSDAGSTEFLPVQAAPVGQVAQPYDGVTLGCTGGAAPVGANGCSLLPDTRYTYRVSYALQDVPDWRSAAVTARR